MAEALQTLNTHNLGGEITVSKVCVYDHISWQTLDQSLMKSKQRHTSIARVLEIQTAKISSQNLLKSVWRLHSAHWWLWGSGAIRTLEV